MASILDTSVDTTPQYTVDDLTPKEGETPETYGSRIGQIPEETRDQLYRERWPDSELLPKQGETPDTYSQRLQSTVPADRIEEFRQSAIQAVRQSKMYPQAGETPETYSKRLSENYSEQEIDDFRPHLQVLAQQQDIEQQKQIYGKELELAPSVISGPAATAIAGAKFFTFGLSEPGLASAGATLDWFKSLPDQAKTSWAELYNQNLNSIQAYREAIYEKHPLWYGAGAVAGSLKGVGAVGKVTPGLNVVQQTAVDATMFGILGANEGKERFSNGQYVEVAENAAKAGIEGAAAGLAIRGAVAAAVSVGKQVSTQSAKYLVSQLDKVGFNLDASVAEDLEANSAKEEAFKNSILTKIDDEPEAWKSWAVNTPANEKAEFLKEVSPEAAEQAKELIGTKFADPVEMNDFLAFQTLKKERQAFASFNGVDSVNELVDKNSPLLDSGYDLWRKSIYAKDALEEGLRGVVNDDSYKLIKRAAMYLADGSYVGAAIDNKWGTKVGYLMNKAAEASNLSEITTMAVFEDTSTLEGMVKRVPSLSEDVNYTDVFTQPDGKIISQDVVAPKLRAALRSDEIYDKLSTEEKQVVDYARNILDNGRELSNLSGQPLGYQVNFVPDKVLKPVKLIPAIKNEVDRLSAKYSVDLESLTEENFQNLSGGSKDFNELMSVLSRFTKVNIEDSRTFDQALQQMLVPNPALMKNLVTASTLIEKEGTMPWFIKELDVPTSIRDWAANTYKAAYLNPILQQMSAIADQLAQKDNLASSYIKNLVGDITRTRDTIGKNVSRWVDAQSAVLASPISTPVQKVVAVAAKGTSALVNLIGKQIYPVTMGLNPKVVVRHVVQPYTMMASDLTGVGRSALENPFFGQRMALQGEMNVGLLKRYGWNGQTGISGVAAKLKELGYYPPNEMFEAMQEALNGPKGPIASTMNAANWISMAPFETSLIVARATGVETGAIIGEKIVSGLNKMKVGESLTRDEASALSFLREMQPGYRVKMQDNIRNWYNSVDKEAVENQIRKDTISYLVAKPYFHFNRATMSQFGREYGWIASMFTKWPATVASDLVMKKQDFGLSGAALRTMKQYFAPLMAAHVVDSLILGDQLRDRSSTARLAVGAGGTASLLPGQSLLDLASRGYRPPVIDVGLEGYTALKDLLTGDPKLGREIDKLYNTVGPFAQYFNAYQKIMSASTGDQPETISQFFSRLGE